MSRDKLIALAFPTFEPHLVATQHGIMKYARKHTNWSFTTAPETHDKNLNCWRNWHGDGMIILADTRAQTKIPRELNIPTVNLSGAIQDNGLPRVMVDHKALGRMAAEHLLDCGFRNFASYGLQRVWYSQQRKHGFIKRIAQEGCECSVLDSSSCINTRTAWMTWQKDLKNWLKTLDSPVGMMAVNDTRGTMVIESCVRQGLRVPDDVAVIGIDNNEILCDFCARPLSSISRNSVHVGYEAAQLLDRLMHGEEPPKGETLVTPGEIVRRLSTDVVAINDPHVAAAVSFVREHIDEVFGIESLLPVAQLSRRWLNYRFKQSLGVTPYEFICRARVQRAKELLVAKPKLPLNKITEACGFHDSRRFRLVFERLTSSTPAKYRRDHT